MSERIGAALRRGAAALAAAGVPGAAGDARALLLWAAGLEAAALTAASGDALAPAAARRFEAALAERAARRPVAQITGRRLFWGRSFRVTPDVLDPRPESETLIAAALERPAPRRVLDLGVGSGCLLATILAERPGAAGLGVDESAAALAVAAENLAALGVADRARLRRGDWLAGVEGRFDLVVANPPYVTEAEWAALDDDVRLYEPRGALTPGGDGLSAYRAIASGLARVLAPGGAALFEIGPRQAAAVAAILAAAGFAAPEIRTDLDGRDRTLIVRAGRPGQGPAI